MKPANPKITFTFKDFEPTDEDDILPDSGLSKRKTTAFAMQFGTSKWRKLQKQLAEYLPDELPFSKEEIRKMSDAEYAKHREEILRSQQRPDKNRVVAEIHAPDLRTQGVEGQLMFIENWGHQRYFQAMEMNPRLDDEALAKASGREWKPYTRTVSESKESVQKRERERTETRKEELLTASSDNGSN